MPIIEAIILARPDKSGIDWSAVAWDVGSVCLGCVVAWLVRDFLARQAAASNQGGLSLKYVTSVMAGGVVLKLLTLFSLRLWAYCIGLLIGIVAYRLIK
jgi:hypothetical protein